MLNLSTFHHGFPRQLVALAALALASACLWPNSAAAATAYLRADAATVGAGDTIILDVRLGTEGASLNVVEGELRVQAAPGALEMRDLSVAGADLSLWPRKPSWDVNQQTITFTGGMPGGLRQPEALLFRIVLLAKNPGQITVTPTKLTAFTNDGRGTAVPVTGQPLTFNVGPASNVPRDALRDLVSADNEPPRFVAVNVGQDPSVYDGLLFLAIEVADDQSGLDHLEVAEGSRPAVRTGSVYVLQDQSRAAPVVITAYDRAGNVSTFTLGVVPPSQGTPTGRWVIAVALLALAVALLAGTWLRRWCRRGQPRP